MIYYICLRVHQGAMTFLYGVVNNLSCSEFCFYFEINNHWPVADIILDPPRPSTAGLQILLSHLTRLFWSKQRFLIYRPTVVLRCIMVQGKSLFQTLRLEWNEKIGFGDVSDSFFNSCRAYTSGHFARAKGERYDVSTIWGYLTLVGLIYNYKCVSRIETA